MKIYIVGTRNSETPEKLTGHIKNCESGYEIPEFEEDVFIVNYGRTNVKSNLNKRLVTNKLQQFKLLKDNEMNVPKIYGFLKNYNGENVFPRNIPREFFPLLARKHHHSRGSDIIYLKRRFSIKKRWDRVKSRDFLCEYIPKEAEFRVHVLGEEVLNVSQKIPSPSFEKHHPHVWSSSRGWTLDNYDGELYEQLSELGIKAIKSLNYDFGAVDIILGKDGKFYVLEVNSAPRLSRQRRRLYSRYFRVKEKEYRRKLKEERNNAQI